MQNLVVYLLQVDSSALLDSAGKTGSRQIFLRLTERQITDNLIIYLKRAFPTLPMFNKIYCSICFFYFKILNEEFVFFTFCCTNNIGSIYFSAIHHHCDRICVVYFPQN